MPVYPQLITEQSRWMAYNLRMQRIIGSYIAGGGATSNIVHLTAQFTIGDGEPLTPANGATMYANPALDGKTILIFKNGYGLPYLWHRL